MNETIQIKDRTLTNIIKPSGVKFLVESITHDADWGPKAARVRAEGSLEALNKLLLLLRGELTVLDAAGREMWWGCIWSVEIYKGSIKYGLTLDGFANKINIIYLQQTINQQFSGAGTQAETGFASEAASVAEYGTFEMRLRGENSSAAAAVAEQSKELVNRGLPQSIGTTVSSLRSGARVQGAEARGEGKEGEVYAVIGCWGWKKTLDKRFYANDSGNEAGVEQNSGLTSEAAQVLGRAHPAKTTIAFASTKRITATKSDLAVGDDPPLNDIYITGSASNNKRWVVQTTVEPGRLYDVVTPPNVATEAAGASVVVHDVGTRAYQTFQLSSNHPFYAAAIDVRLQKDGSPTDNVTVKLYTDSAGTPGSLLATGTIANIEIGTSMAWKTAVLNTPSLLAYGTLYGIEVSRSGSEALDCFRLGLDEGSGYGGGALKLYAGSVSGWVSRTVGADLIFKVSGLVETTTQIQSVVASVGEFISGVVVENASGRFTLPYRDGSETALQVVQSLQAKPTTNLRRLLSRINVKRQLVVAEEPAPTASTAYRLRDDGLLYTLSGQPIPPHTCPVGQWATVDALVLAQVSTTHTSTAQVFIEEVEYKPADGTFRIVRTRDRRSDFSMTGFEQ